MGRNDIDLRGESLPDLVRQKMSRCKYHNNVGLSKSCTIKFSFSFDHLNCSQKHTVKNIGGTLPYFLCFVMSCM